MAKKKILLLATFIVSVGLAIHLVPGIFDYIEFQQAVEASTGMPAQDGGKITMVRQPCILDTPASSPTTCAISCPLVTSALATACAGYIEIDTTGQMGTAFIAAPLGFQYKGGCTMPVAGMSFIYGGSSNIMPWVIGCPSAAASRIQKLVDTFRRLVALL